ncbi:MAG TPA: hypothetical protein VJC39_04150 [Candidatus Nanoarchaeia archaeon]|nr:hypothetical protein [Candidatus Nanoarchaeia archaeon]
MKDNEKNILIIALIGGFVLFIFFSGFGMMGWGNYGIGGMMNWMFGTGFGFGIFGFIIPLLIVIALVLLIVWLVKKLQIPAKRK